MVLELKSGIKGHRVLKDTVIALPVTSFRTCIVPSIFLGHVRSVTAHRVV